MKLFRFRDVVPELPNILVRRRFRFRFEMLPFEARDLTRKKIGNFFVAGLNQFLLPATPLGYPVIAQVEPANFCNLSCPLCLTTSETGSRPRAVLPLEAFHRLIEEVGDYLLLIILWNWGEPFLNPDIFKMIACAKAKGILVHSSTNGNVSFDGGRAEELVESGLDSLVLGVDGATPETYAAYRRGGRLDRVRANIRAIVQAKKRMGSRTPRLNLRCVVMRQNEHELPLMKRLAEELEVDFFTLKTVDLPSVCGEELDRTFAPENGKYRRYDYVPGSFRRRSRPFTCMRPWKRITMDASGTVIACEMDYENREAFGTVGTAGSALAAWKGSPAQMLRRRFDRGNGEVAFCKTCTYKNRVADDCVVERIRLSGQEGAS